LVHFGVRLVGRERFGSRDLAQQIAIAAIDVNGLLQRRALFTERAEARLIKRAGRVG
jgi:hypothetical protein